MYFYVSCRVTYCIVDQSNWCSFECSRKLREARVWNSPQLVGWGRVGTCDQRCGWSLWKQGAGHSAPSRRAWFDGALRRVHMATRRVRINGCDGAWRVLSRRKRGPRPRTPVHKAPLRLPCRRPRLALPGMARGSARGTASDLGWLRRGRPHTKRQARRHKGRGRAKRTNNSGRTRGSAFVSSNQPSGSRSRRVGRKSSGPPSRRIHTRPRTEGAEARTVSLIRPGLPVRNEEATPRTGKRCPRSPSRRRSSSQRHDQRKSDCRLRRRLASVVKEYQGIREELGCGQSARHKMLMTVAERTMQQVMLLEARKSKRRKHNKKSTRKRRTASSSASWTGSGATSDTESEDLGLELSSGVMEVSKQYPGWLLRSFLQTIGSQVVTTGDTQGALGEVRLLELVPDLATKYLDKITKRRSFAVGTSAEMRVLAEVMDSLMAGHTRGRHHCPEVPSPPSTLPPKGDRGAKRSTWNWPLWTELRL